MTKNRVKISLSEERQGIEDIANHREITHRSINYYHSQKNIDFEGLFFGLSPSELEEKRYQTDLENDTLIGFNLLTAIEAMFRLDFIARVNNKGKDDLSRHFYQLHQEKELRVSLENDIFSGWEEHVTLDRDSTAIFRELRGAFKYRHHIAHGRYWEPKLGRKNYDYETIYQFAEIVQQLIKPKF